MSSYVYGEPLPEPRRPKIVPVVTARLNKSIKAWLLDERIWGYTIHWDGVPFRCTRLQGQCDRCGLGFEKRWAGFAPAFSIIELRQVIVMLTEASCRQLMTWRESNPALRGAAVHLFRKGTDPNARVYLEVIGQKVMDDAWKSFDPSPSVLELFALNERRRKEMGFN